MCLGGHLAYRCALDPRISAAILYFATDLHSRTLGAGRADNSLLRAGEIQGELALIHGVQDPHVPAEGRDVIRARLREAGVVFSWYEVAGAQHAFIRDEMSKGRYDAAVSKVCFEMLVELFGRVLKVDRGEKVGGERVVENVC
jgi:carboxymethylenebutenolidase